MKQAGFTFWRRSCPHPYGYRIVCHIFSDELKLRFQGINRVKKVGIGPMQIIFKCELSGSSVKIYKAEGPNFDNFGFGLVAGAD